MLRQSNRPALTLKRDKGVYMSFKKLLIILAAVSAVFAGTYGNLIVKKGCLVKVYDGDTFYINIKSIPKIFGDTIPVRIYGIDTPELKTKDTTEKQLAIKARDTLTKLLTTAKKIELRNVERDKYFRILGDVYVNDTISVSKYMVSRGLAREYFGGTKEDW